MKKTLLSVFAVAALALTASAQIPNAGFETWGTTVGEDTQPTGWVSYNVFTAPIIDPSNTNPTSVFQAPSPNNYQGTYSAKIVTVDLVTNPSSSTIPNRGGFMMVGSISFVAPYLYSGYQYTARPNTFSYAAKYTPSGVDTAIALVALTHWNGSTRDTVAYAIDYIPVAVGNYAVRTMNLVYNASLNNVSPDTGIVYFSASSLTAPQAGSALWVDALEFTGWNSVNENSLAHGVDIYPNPSSTITNFDVVADNAYEVVVYDMNGREVNRTPIIAKNARVNSAELAEGIYTYSIVTKENEVISRGKFAVAQ
jgi:hypothetical protein